MTYDFTVIPGNSGIETNDLGLVLRYKDAEDAVIDLTGATLHFTADHGSTTCCLSPHRTLHGIMPPGKLWSRFPWMIPAKLASTYT